MTKKKDYNFCVLEILNSGMSKLLINPREGGSKIPQSIRRHPNTTILKPPKESISSSDIRGLFKGLKIPFSPSLFVSKDTSRPLLSHQTMELIINAKEPLYGLKPNCSKWFSIPQK